MMNFIIIPIVLFLVCISLGVVTKYIAHFQERKNNFVVGFVMLFASFYLISTPFMLLNLKFSYMIYVVKGFYIAIMVLGFILSYRMIRNNCRGIVKKCKVFCADRYHFTLFIVFMVFIAYQIGYVVYFQHTDIDDSYYLAQANTYTVTDYICKVEPASGLEYLLPSKQYFLVSFEIIYAVLNKIFGVNIAYLAHTIWPVLAITIHYVVIYMIAQKINNSKKWEFCLLYSVINLFGGYTTYTSGAFLLNRIWQGKAVFVAIFIPIMVLEFLEIYENFSFKEIIYTYMILLAGISTTTVAIYLFPILYFCMWFGRGMAEKNIRSLIKLCLPVIGIIPWVVIKLKLIFTAEKSGVSVQQAVTDGAGGLSYSGQLFTRFLNGHSIIFIGYIVALIIILIWSEKRVKSITVYPSLGLFVTFANPLLIKYIAGWITGVDVYWRIFWLFNSSLVFVVAAIILIDKCINIKEVVLGTTVSIIFIVSCGTSVFENGGWENRINKFKLDTSSIQIVDSIHVDSKKDSKVLLLPEDMSYGIREYCGDICLIVNRYSDGVFKENNMAERYSELQMEIYNPLYVAKQWDSELLDKQINNFNIDYIVIYTSTIQNNQVPDNFSIVYQNNEYTLYRCN